MASQSAAIGVPARTASNDAYAPASGRTELRPPGQPPLLRSGHPRWSCMTNFLFTLAGYFALLQVTGGQCCVQAGDVRLFGDKGREDMLLPADDWSPHDGPVSDASVPRWIADVYEGDQN